VGAVPTGRQNLFICWSCLVAPLDWGVQGISKECGCSYEVASGRVCEGRLLVQALCVRAADLAALVDESGVTVWGLLWIGRHRLSPFPASQ
jgi:hypothetical protein